MTLEVLLIALLVLLVLVSDERRRGDGRRVLTVLRKQLSLVMAVAESLADHEILAGAKSRKKNNTSEARATISFFSSRVDLPLSCPLSFYGVVTPIRLFVFLCSIRFGHDITMTSSGNKCHK